MPFGRSTRAILMAQKSYRQESVELIQLTALAFPPPVPPSSCISLGNADLVVSNILYILMVIYHFSSCFPVNAKVLITSCYTHRCSIKTSVGLTDAPTVS